MRQKVVKVLRKRIYGNFSVRVKEYMIDNNKTVRVSGKRALYQQAKRKYLEDRKR